MRAAARGICIWVAVALIVGLLAVMVRSAEAATAEPSWWTYRTTATVEVTSPRGRCRAVRAPATIRVNGEGVSFTTSVPGPLGRPHRSTVRRSWRSLYAEAIEAGAESLTPYVERLSRLAAPQEGRP